MQRVKNACHTAVALLLVSCQQQEPIGNPGETASQLRLATSQELTKAKVQLEEFFVDSLAIGKRKQHKLTISKFRTPDSLYVNIRFYRRQLRGWTLRNSFHFKKDGLTDLNPVVADFNHDGLKDFIYQSAAAARGGNQVQRLFLYDYPHDRLFCIKNTHEYPNLLYNKGLNCLDAFSLHAGCTTSFLKISGDSLRKFASVELLNGLTVRTYDQRGKGEVIFRDTTNKDEYIRYQNYYPLKAYK